jgi:hypothetical protein
MKQNNSAEGGNDIEVISLCVQICNPSMTEEEAAIKIMEVLQTGQEEIVISPEPPQSKTPTDEDIAWAHRVISEWHNNDPQHKSATPQVADSNSVPLAQNIPSNKEEWRMRLWDDYVEFIFGVDDRDTNKMQSEIFNWFYQKAAVPRDQEIERLREIEKKYNLIKAKMGGKGWFSQEYVDEIGKEFTAATEQIKNLEGELAAARGGGWISVDENPPDKSGHYLVYDQNTAGKEKREMYRFDSYNKSWYWGADTFHPQFWQPLPPSPPTQSPEEKTSL